jgi:hypothetical protein
MYHHNFFQPNGVPSHYKITKHTRKSTTSPIFNASVVTLTCEYCPWEAIFEMDKLKCSFRALTGLARRLSVEHDSVCKWNTNGRQNYFKTQYAKQQDKLFQEIARAVGKEGVQKALAETKSDIIKKQLQKILAAAEENERVQGKGATLALVAAARGEPEPECPEPMEIEVPGIH